MTSLRDRAIQQFSALCDVFDIGPGMAVPTFHELLGHAGDQSLVQPPTWESSIPDDGTPTRAIGGSDTRSVRILGESIARYNSAESKLRAAEEYLGLFARRFELNLGRYLRIRDLFLPVREDSLFTLWFLSCSPVANRVSKIYFNPEVRGSRADRGLVAEALGRLGFAGVHEAIRAHGLSGGTGEDRCIYLALDLAAGTAARVKVYVAPPRGDRTAGVSGRRRGRG